MPASLDRPVGRDEETEFGELLRDDLEDEPAEGAGRKCYTTAFAACCRI